MSHFFLPGVLVWICRIGFFSVLYMLEPAALDAFLLGASFVLVDLTLCLRIARAERTSKLLTDWRMGAYEDPALEQAPGRMV